MKDPLLTTPLAERTTAAVLAKLVAARPETVALKSCLGETLLGHVEVTRVSDERLIELTCDVRGEAKIIGFGVAALNCLRDGGRAA